jgi:adenylosuccinate lyase
VGSSVMPHKINPISFENSMANAKLSNAIFECLISNLEISKMQRDLSDSSLLRNIGVGYSYSMIAIKQIIKGLSRVSANKTLLEEELENNPEVLAEAIQTVLRKNKYNDAYEKLKELTRGKEVTKEEIKEFIKSLNINEDDKANLLNLNVKDYVGYAKKLCDFMQ